MVYALLAPEPAASKKEQLQNRPGTKGRHHARNHGNKGFRHWGKASFDLQQKDSHHNSPSKNRPACFALHPRLTSNPDFSTIMPPGAGLDFSRRRNTGISFYR